MMLREFGWWGLKESMPTYQIWRKSYEAVLPWEVVRIEEENCVYAEARFARREDAEKYLKQISERSDGLPPKGGDPIP